MTNKKLLIRNKFKYLKKTHSVFLLADVSTSSCSPPELITTEADSTIADPDSEDEVERKDSLDVHEEGTRWKCSLKAMVTRCFFA